MTILKRSWQRYDRFPKYKTKDCGCCKWYRRIGDEDVCGHGIAFKILVPREDPRKCEVKDRKQSDFPEPSVKYLDEILSK